METFIYNARVTDIYDGDTITVTIDCGFGLKMEKQKIRLYGIDTPEVRGEEKEHGKKVRDILREKILDKNILLKTIKDKKGKYGRYLGILFYENVNINDWLIENGHAVEMIY
jgi:micrococcal nuclease